MIVLAVIAVIAAIALPNLLSSRIIANETAAISSLRTIISSESQFQQTGLADKNDNGFGEYGYLGEMSGSVGVRGGARISAATLSSAFQSTNAWGVVSRGGYLYILALPNAAGNPVAQAAHADVDGLLAETVWVCYAWPMHYGYSGNRTFFANQGGDIVATNDPKYSGPHPSGAPMPAGAAFVGPGPLVTITGIAASGVMGRDGNIWRPAG
jgi:type II secretory pathway pseudopilin PulG